ncbi:MAG: VWA domain-containing protein [Lachnospiraceae bacterium]|nr:VWA domain-containing protein [Lachnospiraceae bacterium]
MKKKAIATLLITGIAASALNGCGSMATGNGGSMTETAPTYIEAEYPASVKGDNSTGYSYPSAAAEDYSTGDAGYATTESSESCYAEAPAAEDYRIADSSESWAAKQYDGAYDTLCPGLYYPPYNSGENYKSYSENPFTNAASQPLSTFGADIDTASYANFRRMVNDGYRLTDIPSGSIRTEELVNYFHYDYRSPGRDDAFAVNASIIDCPWNDETKLVNLGIKAKDLTDISDVASNIVFLVDVSGSMNSYDKLPLLKMGLDMLVDDLDENDRVSIVTYASSSDIVLAGVCGNEHTTIKRAINSLDASGSTNGGDGIISAYKLAEKYFIKGGNNRVIMATDGDLNVGITSESELEALISDKKESGVFLSVLGFGTGNYNEATLETLADKGNGNYSYIDCLSEAKKVLIDEFGSTLFTVAKDVKFQIEFNPKYVSEYCQIGYENRQMAASDFTDDTKDGGEIGSGHEMTVLYEVRLNDENVNDSVPLRYQNTDLSDTGAYSDEWMMVSVRYKNPDKDTSKQLYFPIRSECYTKNPNCDTLFAAYVATCGMILNDSEYAGRLDMRDVAKQVAMLDLNDEYKEEFLSLIRQL